MMNAIVILFAQCLDHGHELSLGGENLPDRATLVLCINGYKV